MMNNHYLFAAWIILVAILVITTVIRVHLIERRVANLEKFSVNMFISLGLHGEHDERGKTDFGAGKSCEKGECCTDRCNDKGVD